MKSLLNNIIFLFLCFFLNVVTIKAQSKIKNEDFPFEIDHTNQLIKNSQIPIQNPPLNGQQKSIEGLLVSKVVQGVMKLIDDRKKKYNSVYEYLKYDGSFYNQISVNGPFDPSNISFKGFTICRTFENTNGNIDTAFIAKFVIDTSNSNGMNHVLEIFNNGIFHLKLESILVKNARVKMPDKDLKLNMDFEIKFVASFINGNAQMNTDQVLGNFVYSLRNAPIDPKSEGYENFYASLKNVDCAGQSFLVPRSRGWYKNSQNELKQCWGLGNYSIQVKVTESSKSNFVDKMIFIGSNDMITIGNEALEKKFGSAPSAPVRQY